METVYEKKESASAVLMEYYAYCELRKFVQDDWEKEDTKYEKQCEFLYSKYEELHKKENHKLEQSKSTKVAKKLEDIKDKPDYSDTVLLKKLRKKL